MAWIECSFRIIYRHDRTHGGRESTDTAASSPATHDATATESLPGQCCSTEPANSTAADAAERSSTAAPTEHSHRRYHVSERGGPELAIDDLSTGESSEECVPSICNESHESNDAWWSELTEPGLIVGASLGSAAPDSTEQVQKVLARKVVIILI